MPYKEGIQVLKVNEEIFAAARANREYEIVWEAFHRKKWDLDKRANSNKHATTLDIEGKAYLEKQDIADDVYNFYGFFDVHIEKFPHVRMVGTNDAEGVVLEIPVDGLSLNPTRDVQIDIPAEKFVIIHYENGMNQIIPRRLLVSKEYKQQFGSFRVIK